MEKICRTIDMINEKTGIVCGVVIIIIMLIQALEIILRYIFNSPTIWSWDINQQLFIATSMIGGGYALLHNFHIRVDILYRRMRPSVRFAFDSIVFPFIVMVFIIIIWTGAETAWSTWVNKTRAPSLFAPPLWPIKSVLCIAGFLFLIQIIANFYRRFVNHFNNSEKRGLPHE